MPGANLSTFDSILKNQYLGPIREQVNNDVVLLQQLDKDSDSVVGKNFTIPLHTGGNEGIAALGENGTLPTAGAQSYKETIVPMRYVYGRIQITGPTIKAARSDAGAFVRAIDSETKGLTRDLKREINRMFWNDGTGVMAVCGTTAAATTVVVDSTKFLRVGQKVDIIKTADGTTGTGATGRVITGVPSATTITIDGAAITTDNTYGVYRAGSRNLEVMGLGGIFSATKALQGLDPATYSFWKSNILDNTGTNRAISENLLQTAMDTTEVNSDGDVKLIMTTYGVSRAYQALLTATRQYMNTMDLKGGRKALTMNNKALVVDKDAPANKLFMLDTEALKIYELSDFSWMDQDGAILSRVPNVDAYEATLYRYFELGCNTRNSQTLLADITEA